MNANIDKETQSTRVKYNRNSGFYDLMEFPIELLWYRKWRKRLLAEIENGKKILEVGVGTGKNSRFYSDSVTAFGIDLSEGMFAKAIEHGRMGQMRLAQADVQHLPFRDDSFDIVVATFVFCSVPDPVVGFREVLRVLKADGQSLLLEHVLPKNAALARAFNCFDKWIAPSTGVHINRRTEDNIRKAGLSLVEEKHLFGSIYRFFRSQPQMIGAFDRED